MASACVWLLDIGGGLASCSLFGQALDQARSLDNTSCMANQPSLSQMTRHFATHAAAETDDATEQAAMVIEALQENDVTVDEFVVQGVRLACGLSLRGPTIYGT